MPRVSGLGEGARRLATEAGVRNEDDSKRLDGETAHVIDHALLGVVVPGEAHYRLIANVLDPDPVSASEFAALCHERWEIASVFGEFKTYLRGASTVLSLRAGPCDPRALTRLW